MKVLIATPEKYVPFIMGAVRPYENQHAILINHHHPTSDFTNYDVGISFLWERKIQKFELEIAPWINFHPAPLPDYGGRNLCYHAIINEEKEFGATIHYMDENFDTGDIIHVDKFSIEPWYTAEDVSKHAILGSKHLFREYFPRILTGEQFERLPNIGGTYYKKEKIDNLIDIQHNAIDRKVRAIYFPPYYPKIDIGGVIYKIVRDE